MLDIANLQWRRIRFSVNLPPRGQARARSTVLTDKDGQVVKSRKTGRAVIIHHKSEQQETDERKLESLLFDHKPERPFAGPIRLQVAAFFPIPVSKSKKWKALAEVNAVRPVGKPDWDNVIKHVADVMTGVFWEDDKQIVSGACAKYFGHPPRYEVVVEYLEAEQTGFNGR